MPQTLLAIDDVSLPLRKNVCLYLSKPTVRRERMDPVTGFADGFVAGPDGLECDVRWKDRAVAELAGRVVRVRVNLKRLGEVSTGIDRSRQQPKDNPNELR